MDINFIRSLAYPEVIEEISNGGENKKIKIIKLLEEVSQLINEL